MAVKTNNWESAFKIMRDNYELTDDSIGIFALTLRFGLDDIRTVALESITGGGDDKKCDVLFVDKEKEIAVIAQCYLAQTKKNSAPANKAADLNTALTWLLNQPLEALPGALRGRADELRSAINSGDIKQFYIWYVHNLPKSENVSNELKAVEQTARSALKKFPSGSDIAIFAQEVCAAEIERLYNQAERTVIVTDSFPILIPGAVEISSDNWSSIMTVVPGNWLNELYHKYKTDLFSANLRGYLGSRDSDSNINNGIKTTAYSEPENFYVYNNGITALVLDYSLGRRSRGRQTLTITGISIVNGAQTTGSLSNAPGSLSTDLKVAIRFVKAKRDNIVENVVRYNNSQNKLQAADFRSTDPIQDRLRTEFESVPDAEYEGGRRGGASDAIKRSKFTLPSYTVGQSLASFHINPVAAYDKKSELWTNESNYRHIFTDRTTARHIVFCYSLLNIITKRKINLSQKHKTDLTSLTSLENDQLKFLSNKGASYLVVYAISQCMETILNRPIPNKADLHFALNISPEQAETIWAPIVDIVLSLSAHLENAFSRNRISNDTVSKAIPGFVGIMASIANLQRENFNKFAAQVRT
ncbi:AIPR family protein [Methylobacterium indicum]|uniref:AIPR family protein n=1 Tax=Methylobacterium indicum TaxID=1775910 RepID=UPI0009E86D17|nr:AIPR family protein [Methylobacterium indicum]